MLLSIGSILSCDVRYLIGGRESLGEGAWYNCPWSVRQRKDAVGMLHFVLEHRLDPRAVPAVMYSRGFHKEAVGKGPSSLCGNTLAPLKHCSDMQVNVAPATTQKLLFPSASAHSVFRLKLSMSQCSECKVVGTKSWA